MLLLSVLLCGCGLGLVAAGLVGQHLARPAVAGAPAAAAAAPAGPTGTGLPGPADGPQVGLAYRALEPTLVALVAVVRRLSPSRQLELAQRRIVLAGLEGRLTLERLLVQKTGAGAVTGLVALALGAPGQVPALLWAAGVGVAGSFLPDLRLSGAADRRQEAVAQALPDALDLLSLTVEAGLGLEQGLEVVVENTDGPLTAELSRLLREVELGVPRREALDGLRDRTSVPELSAFVVALVQSDEMGIALADVLTTQAAQVRLKRRQRARERAAKTPVKILLPVVLGIFPALFVVTVGPGVLAVMQAF